jgi:trehalose utilization protein
MRYFLPGHEVCPAQYDQNAESVLGNAVNWAANPAR